MTEDAELTRDRILRMAQGLILEKGYGGTSLADIVGALGVTKGAFFHHFGSKDELARALIQRYADRDHLSFHEFARRADALTDDPVQSALLLVGLFEEALAQRERPVRGCLFAAYVYQQAQFEPEVRAFLRTTFDGWVRLFETKFDAALQAKPPRLPVTARDLGEMMVALFEGAIILGRAFEDPKAMARQVRQFRSYLRLLFDA